MGGLKHGQSCNDDSDCYTCYGGPEHGEDCTNDSQCAGSACDSGPYSGQTCSNDADCGVCVSGPSLGEACGGHGDCGACLTGNAPGHACANNHDCAVFCAQGQPLACDGGIQDGVPCVEDYECTGTDYPVLQRTDGTPHASLAIGLMSIYDPDPCDLDQGYYPSEWRLAVFDGLEWQTFQAPKFDIPLRPPPHYQDLMPLYGWNCVDFAIGADYVEVRITNIQSEALYSGNAKCVFNTCQGGASYANECLYDSDCAPGPGMIPDEYLVARVPRKYKGPFNKYALGPGKGRDVTDPENPGPEECLAALSSADIISDEIVLYDGVLDYRWPRGACCLPDASCVLANQADCVETYQGVWRGAEADCPSTVCCPVPWADVNHDNDVDQEDFAVLQRCFTGDDGSVAGVCECFDRNDNEHVDADDVGLFASCATGPGVPYDLDSAPPGCAE